MEIRAKQSDKGFEEYNFLVKAYSAYKHNHIHLDLRGFLEVELNAEIQGIYELLEEYHEVGEL